MVLPEMLTLLVVEDNRDVRTIIKNELAVCPGHEIELFIPDNLNDVQQLIKMPEVFSLAFFDSDLSEWNTSIDGEKLAEEYVEHSHAPKDIVFDISSQLHRFDHIGIKHLGKTGLVYWIRAGFGEWPTNVCGMKEKN